MEHKVIRQIVIVDKESIDKNQNLEKVALFSDDGSPFVFSEGADLTQLGTPVEEVTPWGIPGFVSPAAVDFSEGWMIVTPGFADQGPEITIGWGDSVAYFDTYGSALGWTLNLAHESGADIQFDVFGNTTYASFRAPPGQEATIVAVTDSNDNNLFSVTPSGDDDGGAVLSFGEGAYGFGVSPAAKASAATLTSVELIVAELFAHGLVAA